jgi:hypothetical protein
VSALRACSALIVLALLAGCVQGGERAIDHARGNGADQPQESVAGPDDTNATTTTTSGGDVANVSSSATPVPAPAAAVPPSAQPAPTPLVASAPPSAGPSGSGAPPPSGPSAPPPVSSPPPTAGPPPPSPSPAPPPTPAPSPAPAPAWPHEGSYVSYTDESHTGCPNGCYQQDVYANATWTYHDGDWSGTCDQQMHQWWQGNDTWYNTTQHFVYSAAKPPHWPLFDTTNPPAKGGNVTAWLLNGCRIESRGMVYNGTVVSKEYGQVNEATDTPEAEANYSDFLSWWSPRTGLVDAWSWYALEATAMWGHLTRTDAP